MTQITQEKILDLAAQMIADWPDHPGLPKMLAPYCGTLPAPNAVKMSTLVDLVGRLAYQLQDTFYTEGGDFVGLMEAAEEYKFLSAKELYELLNLLKENWNSKDREYSYASEVHLSDDKPVKIKINGGIVAIEGAFSYWSEGDYRDLDFCYSVELISPGDPSHIVADLDKIKTVGELISRLQEMKPDQPLTIVDNGILGYPKDA